MRRNFVSAAFLLLIKCKLNAPDLIFSFICDTIHLYQAKIYFQSKNILSENQNREKVMAKIQESGEMYLETIYILSKKGPVRSTDVAEHMGYSKPSISRAVGLLKSSGYLLMDKEGYLTLTDAGLEIASKMYERHILLSEFLVRLGVDKDVAAADACKIEHVISEESFEAIKSHIHKQK